MPKGWLENSSDIDSKIEEWWKQMWKWISEVISGACATLWKTLSAWVNLVWAWVSKIQEKFVDENDADLKKSKETITKARVEKAKAKWKHALKSAKKAIWWWWDAVKWTWKVAVHSVKKTIKDYDSEKQAA